MVITPSPPPLPVVASKPEARVPAAQPVKTPSFASLLKQNHPPAPPAVPPAIGQANGGDTAAMAEAGGRPNSTGGKPKAAAADRSRRPSTKTADDAPGDADEGTTRSDDATPSASGHPMLAHWMSHPARPADAATAAALPNATATLADAATASGDTDASAADALATGGLATGAGRVDTNAADATASKRFEGAQTDAIAGLPAAASDKAGTGEKSPPLLIAAADNTPATASTSALGMGSAAGAGRSAEAAATVAIATPVNAPDFAQALGVHLSVLATDGVHHAELHLNPADMGPVSVQIVMDGNQAHIDFGADVAATRHAIEAGLPELAGALRDAGFTLTGGGVSQHARGGQGGDGRDDPRGQTPDRLGIGGAADADASVQRGLRRSFTLGGLDLYA